MVHINNVSSGTEIQSMADDTEAEIREIKLKIDNLVHAASFRHVPQEVTIAYLKELQILRQRLHELSGDTED